MGNSTHTSESQNEQAPAIHRMERERRKIAKFRANRNSFTFCMRAQWPALGRKNCRSVTTRQTESRHKTNKQNPSNKLSTVQLFVPGFCVISDVCHRTHWIFFLFGRKKERTDSSIVSKMAIHCARTMEIDSMEFVCRCGWRRNKVNGWIRWIHEIGCYCQWKQSLQITSIRQPRKSQKFTSGEYSSNLIQ